jgi:hypothetical protein
MGTGADERDLIRRTHAGKQQLPYVLVHVSVPL